LNESRSFGINNGTMKTLLSAQLYGLATASGMYRLKYENFRLPDNISYKSSFISIGYREKVNLTFFEDIDNLSDAVSVSVGLYDGTEFRLRPT
jgi:hypothetical protein